MTPRSSNCSSQTNALGWGHFAYRSRSRFDYRAHFEAAFVPSRIVGQKPPIRAGNGRGRQRSLRAKKRAQRAFEIARREAVEPQLGDAAIDAL